MKFGEYELLKRLGAGGMGEAWLAQKGDAAPVVIKRVLPQLVARPESLQQFLHEARVMARIHDACVARTVELGEVKGEWFIAMEFVDGEDVQAMLERGPLTLEQVRRIGADGAQALLAAHGARDANGRASPVIHRDVSPHNLLFGKNGRVRLIDFGVASLTGAGESGGKYAYAAPEQLLEDVTSPLSDQYSLGVVLWECLSGRSAFDAEEDVEIIRRVTEEGIGALPESVPEDLRETVMKMCALNPGDRYSDLHEVRDALSHEERVRGAGVRGAIATETARERRFTVEQAEALYGREMLPEMLASGELRAEDVDGERFFVKPA